MDSPINPDNYLNLKEAAQCVGVATTTLRSWEFKSGVDVLRHPRTGYRLYTIQNLKDILDAIKGVPGLRTI